MKSILDYLSYVLFWGAVLFLLGSGLTAFFKAVLVMVDVFGVGLCFAIPPVCYLAYRWGFRR